MVEVRRPRKGKKMIKVLKEGQNRYIAICPNCESIMEFAKIIILIPRLSVLSAPSATIYYFMVKGAHKDD